MKKIKIWISAILVCQISFVSPAKSDIFGGDVAMLAQILANAVKQLYELQQIVQNGRDTLGLIRDINRGVNDSLALVDSLGPYIDPGLYKDLRNVAEIITHLREIYGIVSKSPEAQIQNDTDQVVAESLSLNNNLFQYAKELDQIGERIKSFSHNVSPGGAQKLTAQTLGVMVQVMNHQMRAQGQVMKLQAQSLAVTNKKEKDSTRAYMEQAATLRAAMNQQDPKFEFPRF
jgi:hypothetical protein